MKLKPKQTRIIELEHGIKTFEVFTISGYEVTKERTVSEDYPPYTFYRVNRDRSIAYLPDIYYHDPILDVDDDVPFFYIQTVSYGGLPLAEHKRFVKGVTEGNKVAQALTEYFLGG